MNKESFLFFSISAFTPILSSKLLPSLFTFPYIRYALYALGCHCEKGGNPILQGGVHSEVPRDYRLVPHLIFSKKHMSHSNIFVLATLHCMVCNKWLDGAYFKVLYLTRCLKITEKVSFNIASEASNVYILSEQTLTKNAKNGSFWRVFENLKLAVKQCYQTGQF